MSETYRICCKKYPLIKLWSQIQNLRIVARGKVECRCRTPFVKVVGRTSQEYTLFLIPMDVEHILPTILSRTQQLHFRPLSEEMIEQSLIQRYSEDFLVEEIHAKQLCKPKEIICEPFTAVCREEEKMFQDLFMRWMRGVFQYTKDIVLLSEVVAEITSLGRETLKRFLQYTLDAMWSCFLLSSGMQLKIKPFDQVDKSFKTFFPPFKYMLGIYRK